MSPSSVDPTDDHVDMVPFPVGKANRERPGRGGGGLCSALERGQKLPYRFSGNLPSLPYRWGEPPSRKDLPVIDPAESAGRERVKCRGGQTEEVGRLHFASLGQEGFEAFEGRSS